MFDWKDEGFAAPPVLKPARGYERLYRAWGGDPRRKWGNTERPGVCFSLDRALSRWDAERLYSVMEYRNPVRNITEFSVPEHTPLWVGKVDAGDLRAALGGYSGNQVYIERGYLKDVRELGTAVLPDDLGSRAVFSGSLPRTDS